jgi:hypothetical protein
LNIFFVFSAIFILSFPGLFAQVKREWVQRFNGSDNRFDIANSLRLDSESNVYVYGSSSSTGTLTDITGIKYNSSGVLLWSTLFDGYGNSVDQLNGTFLDTDGNSYLTGFSADTNTIIKIVTLKYNSNGDLMWSNICLPPVYLLGSGYAITTDNIQNVYTAGNIGKPNGTYDLILLKYSQSGSLIDSIIYDLGVFSSESATSICIDSAGGNIYVMGSIEQSGSSVDILVVKFNSTLNAVWTKILSGTAALADMPVQMIIGNDNKLIVCAGLNNNATDLDYGIFKLDTNSTVLMQYTFNGSGNNRDIPYSVTSDDTNNIYVTGSSRRADTLGSEDMVTLKLSAGGSLVWSKSYNGIGGGIDYGTSVAVDISGNIYAGGTTNKFGNHVEYALIKYSSTGELMWLEKYSRIFFSEDFVYTAAVDKSANVFITGISFDSLSDYDITTIKYSQPIGVFQISTEIPREFKLYQNYPNPFNPETKIQFHIPGRISSKRSMLRVYDAIGREIETLVNNELKPGIYQVEWNASHLPSGIYFYSFISGDFTETKKMVLIK